MKSNPSASVDLRRLTTAEFARMSRSLQLTLLIIRRAQLASRKVIAATPNWSERYGKRHAKSRSRDDAPST
jgi:hypothetical protein